MNSTALRTLSIDFDDAPSVGVLDLFDTTEVRGSDLRPGMVIVDELDTAAVILTERLPRESDRAAGPRFAGWSPEDGRIVTHEFHANVAFRVATHRLQSCGRCVRANPGAVDWGCTCDMTADEVADAAREFARTHD